MAILCKINWVNKKADSYREPNAEFEMKNKHQEPN